MLASVALYRVRRSSARQLVVVALVGVAVASAQNFESEKGRAS
jgi:hypothetical protein